MTSRVQSRDTAVEAVRWLSLTIFLGFAKLIVFVFDSNPQFFLGDSMSYLTTAMLKWIPPDRSFVYGFLIHDLTTRSRSLSSLVAVQTCAGIGTALLTAVILVRFIRAPFAIAAAVAAVLALEPQQLLYERFVLTESLSTAFFALFVLLGLEYLRARKLWTLVAVQITGVILVAFRVTYLPMVAVAAVAAPFLGCLGGNPGSSGTERSLRSRALGQLAIRLFISLSLFLGLHTAYKNWNGWLSNLPPAYTYADGFFLLANTSPLVTAADADDPELVSVLSRPLVYGNALQQYNSRNAEMFADDGLVERIKGVLKDDYRANIEAKRIAFRVIFRDPLGFTRLAFQTYLKFYCRDYMSEILRDEEGMMEMGPDELKLVSHYHLDAQGLPLMKTLTRQYHFAAWPLYILLVHTPLVLLLCIIVAPEETRRLLLFLLVIATVQVGAVQMLGVEPSPRHLHFASVALAIALGVLAARFWPTGHGLYRSAQKTVEPFTI
jgi:hypothetical protein